MKKTAILMPALLTAASLLSGGCASSLGGGDYSRGEARQAMSLRFAVVDSVRAVKLEGAQTAVGATAGAVVGAAAAHEIARQLGARRGVGSTLGTAIGAVAGGVGGAAVEEAATREDGVEITVILENGEYLAIVQADEGENFQPGERVRLIGGGNSTRVARDPAARN